MNNCNECEVEIVGKNKSEYICDICGEAFCLDCLEWKEEMLVCKNCALTKFTR